MVGRGSPKIPTSLAPLSLIWRNVEFLSHYPPRRILWGYVIFTLWTQLSCLCLHLRSRRPRWTISIVCFFLPRHSLGRISSLCSPGGAITPLGLLQELHTRSALARIPIYRPDETKDGHRPRVSCCPFCAYTVQNDPAYLNHIVGAHYNANFTCGTCLSAVTLSCQQMKRHINECKGLDPPVPPSSQGSAAPPTASQESARGGHSPKKSNQESKHAGCKKKGHHSGKPRPAISASQEDSQGVDRHVTHMAGASQESTAEPMKRHSRRKKKSKSHKKDKSSK